MSYVQKLFLIAAGAVFLLGVWVSRPQPPHAKPVLTPTVAAPSPSGEVEGISVEEETKGTLVTRVIDGDTIQLETGETVRYIGIDTPESVHPQRAVECFGKEAAQKNADLVLNKQVRLEKDVSETDRYGRLLRYVYVGDMLINKELINQGFARSSTYPPDVKFQDQFTAAEGRARIEQRGLWGACRNETGTAATFAPVLPREQGQCEIKGNINAENEKIYHVPGCGSYEKTKIDEARGERYFCSEEDALGAGWRKANNCS